MGLQISPVALKDPKAKALRRHIDEMPDTELAEIALGLSYVAYGNGWVFALPAEAVSDWGGCWFGREDLLMISPKLSKDAQECKAKGLDLVKLASLTRAAARNHCTSLNDYRYLLRRGELIGDKTGIRL